VKVLSGLPKQTDPRILVGSDHFDDAGVARLPDGSALVQSVDFFPPVVDDPWWFGRIAAANALSDLYAMGAVPFSALNLVVFNTKALPMEVLGTILEGGADAVKEAGAMMLGGHSVEDEGVKFGLAVTGLLKAGDEITNSGAKPGDVLYLTKRLGTGCLTTAARKGKTDEADLLAACKQMGALNKDAAESMVEAGAHAATDVTGFGLAGHASEMAAGSGVRVVFKARDLPLLSGAQQLMRKGHASGGAARTRAHLGDTLTVGAGVDEVTVRLATDSETSGGLLIAVSEEHTHRLERALEKRRLLVARVGHVEAGSGIALEA
jgi:selenide,water dikinase